MRARVWRARDAERVVTPLDDLRSSTPQNQPEFNKLFPASEGSGRHRATEPLEAAGDPLHDETAVFMDACSHAKWPASSGWISLLGSRSARYWLARLAGRRRRRRRTRGLSRRAGRARPRRQHAQPASCRAVGHLQGRAATLQGQRRPDGRLRARRGQRLRRLRGLKRRRGLGARPGGQLRRSPHRPARVYAHVQDRPPGAGPRAAVHR